MRETQADTNAVDAQRTVDRADAFRRVAESRLGDACRLASAILGSSSEAGDAVHDAFVVAWQRWPSLRDQNKFDPWFRQIVVNVCRDRLRRTAKQRDVETRTQASDVEPDASLRIHNRLLVEGGLRRLKPDEAIVLALRYYRDLKVDDIAEVLNVPPGTVKSRLNQAHKSLRAILGVDQEAGPR